MRPKKWLLYFILGVVFLACAISQLGTQVLPHILAPSATPSPSATLYATNTLKPLPSLTPEPSKTPIPSATILVETPTRTPTITPTLSPQDPKNSLPPYPDWAAHFDDDQNWSLYSTDHSSAAILDGMFVYRKIPPWSSSEWLLTSPTPENFYLEVTTRTSLRCGSNDRYGLLFAAPNIQGGYFFTISCDGLMHLYAWTGKERIDLINWHGEPAIITGGNQVNHLGVKMVDNQISLFINGVPVGEVKDDTFTSPGRFGFMIASADTYNFMVAFDDLLLWYLP
jgi:hypothetical protein